MTDEVREKYLKAVNIICEQFGLNKPNQIIYVCEAVENLIEPYMKENAELKEQNELLAKRITELQADKGRLIDEVEELKAQIEKMKCPSCIWRDEKALYPTTEESEHIICDECKNHSKWESAK